ncbi:hypothetical protein H6G76_02925 [Nostoc sp. FACHB-152]|uniref:hypothetical protein n=1 Tax=unclassified Nostoc TaxID=2593658 RepID=UPI00168244FC|nr:MULTISPECIES: hypothetical protein [unclassified Nostoc]MBD2446125.1 hypothetical protein [Nostoc sp. FACHB-152]MBD2467357.1 hypothetical protein [Nostoc sp. FACHB-145]
MSKTYLNRGIRLSLVVVAFCVTLVTNTITNAQEAPAIFGDVTLNHPFSPDPMNVRGMSGGSISGSEVAGRTATATGPCTGFVDEAPDHTLELTTKFDYLKLQVQSPEDVTMIVKGPGGTWCNDDLDGKNPGITGEWLPGNYQVWVGSYDQGQYFPYTLKITEVK